MLQISVAFSQREANWWHFGSHVAMDFSSGSPVYSFTSVIGSPQESCATVSDSLGNLLFYTNGDTVWDRNNNIMANGTNLEIGYNSASQGAHIIRNTFNNLYYIFSLGNTYVSHTDRSFLHYAIVDLTQNFGNGAVVIKNVAQPTSDSLLRKMTSAQHCNRKDVWLVVAGVSNSELTLYSYLVTKNGVNPVPIKTTIKDIRKRPWVGQMKFNPNGNLLAWADNNGLSTFNFDNISGKFNSNNFIPLNLNDGYGLEFSPDGNNIYINEKQYNTLTGIITNLLNYDCPSQLQMANDGKIYKIHFPKAEIIELLDGLNIFFYGPISIAPFRFTQIKTPNVSGIGCDFDTAFIYNISANTSNYPLGLPNFPSYYFHHPKGEFSYSGYCAGNTFQFYLKNNPVVGDSIKWIFYDTNQSSVGVTANHTFVNGGNQQVSCLVFNNGKADTTTQCITVCGAGYSALPDTVNSCIGTPVDINGVSPCGSRYKWNTGDTLSGITLRESGNYTLETEGECGTFKETVFVNFIPCDPEYQIPNVFTPNGDGVNDIYSVKLKNVKEIEYYIYDRWGRLVKQNQETINIYNSFMTYNIWDGTQNGNLYNDGTYFMVLNLKAFDDKVIVAKQFITMFKK